MQVLKQATRWAVARLHKSQQEQFYTGRAGENWLSPSRGDAFVYTLEGAGNKVIAFTAMYPEETFIALPLPPVVSLAFDQRELRIIQSALRAVAPTGGGSAPHSLERAIADATQVSADDNLVATYCNTVVDEYKESLT
jgi:hypothetical protein